MSGSTPTVFQVDPATIPEFYYEEGAPFHIMLAGFGMAPDMDEFSSLLSSRRPLAQRQNAVHYANTEVDGLFIEGRQETDRDARKAIYDELQIITSTELPLHPLLQPEALTAGTNNRVQNGEAIFNVWNRPYNWHIESVSVSRRRVADYIRHVPPGLFTRSRNRGTMTRIRPSPNAGTGARSAG